MGTGGEPPAPPPGLLRPDDLATDKICYCMRVHEATLRRAIAAGARDLHTLAAWTRAGTGCGTCRIDLLELLRAAGGAEGER
jgi:NAD(P)H-nitrite reductase large subunit